MRLSITVFLVAGLALSVAWSADNQGAVSQSSSKRSLKGPKGEFRAPKGTFSNQQRDFRTQKGSMKPKAGSYKTAKGSYTQKKGDFKTQGGQMKVAKGQFKSQGAFRGKKGTFADRKILTDKPSDTKTTASSR